MKRCYLTLFFIISVVFARETEYTHSSLMSQLPASGLSKEIEGYEQLVSNTSPNKFLDNCFGIVQLKYVGAQMPTNASGAKVKVNIKYWRKTNNIMLELVQQDIDLSVSFSEGKIVPVDFIRLEGAVKIEAVFGSVTSSTGIDLLPLANLEAKVTILADIITQLSPTSSVSGISSTYFADESSLEVNWLPVGNAEYYELEWTYVSNQDPNNPNDTLKRDKIFLRDFVFRSNSSRVEVSGTSFKIPMIYEKGFVIYRVRPVGHSISNGKKVQVKGLWSLEDNSNNLGRLLEGRKDSYCFFEGLEENLNWQSSVSFAEEGKNKVVVSYHDGSSRSRQAITRINTDKRTIVGETFYDYNGRPVIQVLPVPVVKNNFLYNPRFNRIEDAGQGSAVNMNKSIYDIANEGNSCVSASPKLHKLYGASKYYSGENSFETNGNVGINIINKNLIPDAQKYPYTQTRYTNDNTGRISAQSGVGQTHLLGSNHDTKYLYAVPLQEELSRLFGSQVGLASHYSKNTVIDPNGQVSVSYLDMDGKVVATALAGTLPENSNLSALPGEKARSIKSQLLNSISNMVSQDSLSKSFLQKLVVVQNQVDYKFKYTFSAAPYSITCGLGDGSPVTLNLSAVLDAEIVLKDQCGATVFSRNASAFSPFGQGKTESATIEENASLNIGEYTLSKQLTINETRMSQFVDQYLTDDTYRCIISETRYLQDSVEVLSTLGCEFNCEICRQSMEDVINRINSTRPSDKQLTNEEKALYRERCDDICRGNITCASALNVMIADVSIGGQYGEIRKKNIPNPKMPSIDVNNLTSQTAVSDNIDVPLDPSLDGSTLFPPQSSDIDVRAFRLSIYNPDNILPVSHLLSEKGFNIDWHKPLLITKASPPNVFYDVNKINGVLFKEGVNLTSDVTIEETDYRNEEGIVLMVKVKKLGNGNFQPALIKTESELSAIMVAVPGERDYVNVPLKYLRDIGEFEKFWQPHFANYLVLYHPEFPYFVECTSQFAINEYEYNLVITDLAKDDVGRKFLDSQGKPNFIANDPLFATADPNILEYKKQLGLLLEKYKVLPDGNGFLSIAQVANMGVQCPLESYNCINQNNANCPSNVIQGEDQASWSMLKALYLTERYKIQKKIADRKSISNHYYNGCIGNKDFYSSNENEIFFRRNTELVNSAYQVRVCKYKWWGCSNVQVPVTTVRYSYPQYNPRQTCYISRANEFMEKNRVFYPQNKNIGGVNLELGKCFRTITVGETTAEVEVNCEEDEVNLMKELRTLNLKQQFNDCGLCPLEADLEKFIISAQVKTKLFNTTTAVVAACPPGAAASLDLGGVLKEHFKTNNNNYLPILWTSNYNNTSKILTGTLSSADKNVVISLNFSAWPVALQEEQLNKLKFCCFQSTGATHFTITAYLEGYINTTTDEVVASLDYVPTIDQYKYTQLKTTVVGQVTGLDLKGQCTFPPSCNTTVIARNLIQVLNTMAVKVEEAEAENSKINVMVSNIEVPLFGTITNLYYEVPMRNMFDLTQRKPNSDEPLHLFEKYEFKWKSDLVLIGLLNNKLVGNLSYLSNPDNVDSRMTFKIEVKPENENTSLDYTKVVRFSNIRPINDDTVMPQNVYAKGSFTADAVTESDTGTKTFTRVVISAFAPNGTPLPVTICKQATIIR